SHNLASSGERRMQHRSLYGVKVGIPIGAVHPCMKLSVKWKRMAAGCDSKVRSIGVTIHFNVAESTLIRTRGRKNSGDTIERSEISIGKGIIAGNRRVPRTRVVQRTELPSGLNIPDRFWVDQSRDKTKWL